MGLERWLSDTDSWRTWVLPASGWQLPVTPVLESLMLPSVLCRYLACTWCADMQANTHMYKAKINLIKLESRGQNWSFRRCEVIAMKLVAFTAGLVAMLTMIQMKLIRIQKTERSQWINTLSHQWILLRSHARVEDLVNVQGRPEHFNKTTYR